MIFMKIEGTSRAFQLNTSTCDIFSQMISLADLYRNWADCPLM